MGAKCVFVLFRLLVSTDITYVVFAINGVICYAATALLYLRIYLAVRRHKNQLKALQVQVALNGEMAANFAKVSKSALGTFYVYLAFLACYLPHSFSLAFIILYGSSSATKVSTVYTWILVLSNSSLNPVVYCWKLGPIRRAVINILRNKFTSRNWEKVARQSVGSYNAKENNFILSWFINFCW